VHDGGSSALLQTLIAADPIDEHRLWVFPVVLGEGKRLFESGVPPGGLALVETRSTPKGVLITTYRPAGSRPQGTFHPDNPSEAELARRKKLAAEGSGL
jgi:dihydrofolate reductase